MSTEDEQETLRTALKRVAVTFQESGIPFALGGSYAAWVRGAPEPVHDVDFVIAEDDAGRVQEFLSGNGLRVEQPPEDWLLKVYTDDSLVDLLFRINGEPVTQAQLAHVEELDVLSVHVPVLAAEDLLVQKLRALDEHYCDFGTVIPLARSVREQVNWAVVRERVQGNDFAEVCLDLVVRLGIVTADQLTGENAGANA